MRLLYNIILAFYFAGIKIIAPFHSKARQWVSGRKNLFQQLKKNWNPHQKSIWIHCASLGEFEQGRPVIEQLKKEMPEFKILLTFYSPSGFEIRKQFPLANFVCYMPEDNFKNAQQFLKLVQPDLAIFVKYEFWYYHLKALQQNQIPTLLISARFRPDQPFFKWYGGLHREMLHCFNHIFVQNEASVELLNNSGYHNVTIVGDTRVDRVLNIAENAPAFELISNFVGKSPVLIAGSTWPVDERFLIDFIKNKADKNWKFIIAPHNIEEKFIIDIETRLGVLCIKYSKAAHANLNQPKVMIIDNIGMLSSIYQYGKIAYIGGGFGKGIHNILEPIAFGLPIIFGPNYQKFTEAITLVKQGGAFTVQNGNDFDKAMLFLQSTENYSKATLKAKNYISENKGATTKILNIIKNRHFGKTIKP